MKIFPEGTCVNNEYLVMFKRGAFEIGKLVCFGLALLLAVLFLGRLPPLDLNSLPSSSAKGTCIVPVAIKYNHTFTDAFWNSRKQTFAQHLFKLMVSRAPRFIFALSILFVQSF